jgi:hypothetical protein
MASGERAVFWDSSCGQMTRQAEWSQATSPQSFPRCEEEGLSDYCTSPVLSIDSFLTLNYIATVCPPVAPPV